MITINEYYPSRGFRKVQYSPEEIRVRLQYMPPIHRLAFLTGYDIEISDEDRSSFVDIVPGLEDYLTKSGIFAGYDV